jgi:hypothetical protein
LFPTQLHDFSKKRRTIIRNLWSQVLITSSRNDQHTSQTEEEKWETNTTNNHKKIIFHI